MATKKRPPKKTQVRSTKARRPQQPKKNAVQTARKPDGDDERVAQIQRVIDLMVQNGAVEVELEEAGRRLRVRLKEDVQPATIVAHPPPISHPEVVLSPSAAAAAADDRIDEAAEGEVFVSPMVGTFYRAPAPEAEPFVEVGQRVTADTTLCVIEAMKVMNEIKAEMEGQITAILVENGEPVEFGQPLFRITG